MPSIAERRDQLKRVRLRERFAPSDLYEPAAIGFNLRQNVVKRLLAAAIERIFRVAPRAAQRTPGQSHEHAGLPDKARFALDAMKDFSDAHVISSPRPASHVHGQCAACRGSD